MGRIDRLRSLFDEPQPKLALWVFALAFFPLLRWGAYLILLVVLFRQGLTLRCWPLAGMILGLAISSVDQLASQWAFMERFFFLGLLVLAALLLRTTSSWRSLVLGLSLVLLGVLLLAHAVHGPFEKDWQQAFEHLLSVWSSWASAQGPSTQDILEHLSWMFPYATGIQMFLLALSILMLLALARALYVSLYGLGAFEIELKFSTLPFWLLGVSVGLMCLMLASGRSDLKDAAPLCLLPWTWQGFWSIHARAIAHRSWFFLALLYLLLILAWPVALFFLWWYASLEAYAWHRKVCL